MPPKVAVPAPAAAGATSAPSAMMSGKKITVSIRVLKPHDYEGGVDQPSNRGLRLRAFTTWPQSVSAILTPIFGEVGGSMAWAKVTPEAEDSALVSVVEYSIHKEIKDIDSMREFHHNCGIYFLFSHLNPSIQLVNMLYIDCGILLIDHSQPILLRRHVFGQYETEITVRAEESFMSFKELLPKEPLILRLKSLNAFPVFPQETSTHAIQDSLLYGTISLGGAFHKKILAYPSQTASSLSSASGVDKHPVDVRICCVPGLEDLNAFHQLQQSHTYQLEVYQDDLLERVFSKSNTEQYLSLLQSEPNGLALPPEPVAVTAPAAVAAPAGKKGAPAPAKGAAATAAPVSTAPTLPLVPTTTRASDEAIVKIFMSELERGHQIRPHGCARFRLEQLLAKSSDLLMKFQRKRDPSSQEDHVVVKEDMSLEVRLEKPSQPERWDLPTDMSLLRALSDAKQGIRKTKPQYAARHERYLVSGTTLSISAELHRHLDDTATQFDSDTAIQTIRFGRTLSLQNHACSALSNTGTLLQQSLRPDAVDDAHNTTGSLSPSRTTLKASEHKVDLTEGELQEILAMTPFTRLIVLCDYTDDDTVQALNNGILEINARALPDIQGSIRSHSLSPQEKQDAISGKMDLLSGFMVLDDDRRLVVIEGLAAPQCAMETLYTDYLPRLQANNNTLRILCNPEMLFLTRIYPDYCPDLRRIRIRGKLSKLARRPELYNRKQVDEVCFSAVDALQALTRCEDMKTAKALDIFPTQVSLDRLELLYGEAISKADMDGTNKKLFVETYKPRKNVDGNGSVTTSGGGSATARTNSPRSISTDKDPTGVKAMEVTARQRPELVPTECRNASFEAVLAERATGAHNKDFLLEQRKLRRQAWRQMLLRKQQRTQSLYETMTRVLGTQPLPPHPLDDKDDGSVSSAGAHTASSMPLSGADLSSPLKDGNASSSSSSKDFPPQPKIYLYSIQSENYKSKAWKELRDRVAADKSANYTLSMDYLSQSITPIDEVQERERLKALEQSQRLTQKGFQYPKPKTRKEMIEHPKKPSEARILELQQPFTDALDTAAASAATAGDPEALRLKEREQHYHTLVKAQSLFGGLELPQFQHDFQRKYIGDAAHLPRGVLRNEGQPNDAFFRSVFLLSEEERVEEQRKEQERTSRASIAERCKAKQNQTFMVGSLSVRDTPIVMDRSKDILHDEAKTEALKALRHRTSHRGKDFSYAPAPLSLFSAEPFVAASSEKPRASETVIVRGTETLKDFTRYFNEHEREPPSVANVCKRKHPVLDRSTVSGPKWDSAN